MGIIQFIIILVS